MLIGWQATQIAEMSEDGIINGVSFFCGNRDYLKWFWYG
jgi:hypothetical protein